MDQCRLCFCGDEDGFRLSDLIGRGRGRGGDLGLQLDRIRLMPHPGRRQVGKDAPLLLDRHWEALGKGQRQLSKRLRRGLLTQFRPDDALNGSIWGGQARTLDLDEKGSDLLFHGEFERLSGNFWSEEGG